jgi:hypothetical protein
MRYLRDGRSWRLLIPAGMLFQVGACTGFDLQFYLLTLGAQTTTSVLVEEASRNVLRLLGLAV